MTSQQFQEETREVNGVKIRVTTYKIGDEFHCHISNADPGATIARATGVSKEAALNDALSKASQRLIIKGKSL